MHLSLFSQTPGFRFNFRLGAISLWQQRRSKHGSLSLNTFSSPPTRPAHPAVPGTMFRYSPLGHSATGSTFARLRPRHILLALGTCTFVLLLFTGSAHQQQVASFAHSVSKGRLGTPAAGSEPDTSYPLGALGKFLLGKQRKYLSYKDWQLYLDGHHEMLDRMMDLDVPMVAEQGDEERTEALCEGWNSQLESGDQRWETCWRARMWWQVEDFDLPESFRYVLV